MNSTKHSFSEPPASPARPFSLPIYLLLVFGLSWPFQIAYGLLEMTPTSSFLLSSLSMVMVSVATFIAGRYLFRDGFINAGWSWGKPVHYVLTFLLALLIFALPVAVEAVFGLREFPAGLLLWPILGNFAVYLILTLIPGFGEEFGWRGYMLPRLARMMSIRKALLLHGLIWWAWHLPTLVGVAAKDESLGSILAMRIIILLAVTLIPSVMNAILYAYVWSASGSLAVASFYHSAYDEVRDAIERSLGFAPWFSLWEMGVTTILGLAALTYPYPSLKGGERKSPSF
jgi:uncharacterized protein